MFEAGESCVEVVTESESRKNWLEDDPLEVLAKLSFLRWPNLKNRFDSFIFQIG